MAGKLDDSRNPAVICVHPVHLRLKSFSQSDGKPFCLRGRVAPGLLPE
jgi:hypothetical protein